MRLTKIKNSELHFHWPHQVTSKHMRTVATVLNSTEISVPAQKLSLKWAVTEEPHQESLWCWFSLCLFSTFPVINVNVYDSRTLFFCFLKFKVNWNREKGSGETSTGEQAWPTTNGASPSSLTAKAGLPCWDDTSARVGQLDRLVWWMGYQNDENSNHSFHPDLNCFLGKRMYNLITWPQPERILLPDRDSEKSSPQLGKRHS